MKKDKIIAIIVVVICISIPIFCVLSGNGHKTTQSNYTESKKEINKEKVFNSAWDGSVLQVERYLKNNLRDPDSYQSIEWSKVIKNDNGTFVVRHKYRAKNGFGGYNIEEKIFVLNKDGEIIKINDYKTIK